MVISSSPHKESFRREFGQSMTGFVEGGGTDLVIVTHIRDNLLCDEHDRQRFDCEAGVPLLLVGYQAVDELGIEPKKRAVMFPQFYRGVAVIYRPWPLG